MQRTDFSQMTCSIARSLAVAGEPWSPLVLRDVWVGIDRFDDIQRDLGVSRKVLAERLKHLVEEGMLERRRYSERPARHEYVLTPKGSGFVDVLMAMAAWGDRWTAGEAGPPAGILNRGPPSTGQRADVGPVHVERHCQRRREGPTELLVLVSGGPQAVVEVSHRCDLD